MANTETKKETLERLYRIIDTDATAISFQTLGQYRVFLRDTVRDMIKSCDGGQPSSVLTANELLPLVSGSASDRYRKALGYISEMTFEIEIGTEKGSDVLEKALRIASGYNVE